MIRLNSILLCACLLGLIRATLIEEDRLWQSWKAKYGKTYNSQNGDEAVRRAMWRETVARVTRHNLRYDLGLESYDREVNHYADMTEKESFGNCTQYSPGDNTFPGMKVVRVKPANGNPKSKDWRAEGFVTEPRMQYLGDLKCLSCYAFAAVGALEAQWMKKSKQLVPLSEQQLVSCSQSTGNSGCKEGHPFKCFMYLKQNKMQALSTYPYTAKEDPCKYDAKKGLFLGGQTIHRGVEGKEDVLETMVATLGPVTAVVHSTDAFREYKSGILKDKTCDPAKINHAVLVVGYGSDVRGKYWIVKNSGGKAYGKDGYMKLSKMNSNMCGIATDNTVPTIA